MEKQTSDIETKYMVCTRCYTYNHEHYIKDALNGFVMQQTSFPVITVVVDDASTDKTQEVIRLYVAENFDLSSSDSYERDTDYAHITYAPHKTNKQCWFTVVYLKENHYRQRKPKYHYINEWMNGSKYFAICEGDDYWTDPLKLQKQIQILEQHKDCTMALSNGFLFYEDKKRTFPINPVSIKDSRFLTVSEVLRENGGMFPTASMCYRKEVLQDKPAFFNVPYVGDRPLRMWCALQGKIFYDSTPMVTYRKAVSGSFSERVKNAHNSKTIYNGMSVFLDSFDAYTKQLYHADVQYMKDREEYIYYYRLKDFSSIIKCNYFKTFSIKKRLIVLLKLFKQKLPFL